jgi:hypothetical protein
MGNQQSVTLPSETGNKNNIYMPSETVALRTYQYNVRLNPEGNNDIPKEHDITSLVIVNPPEYLEKIVLMIGNYTTMTFERDDFNQGQNLFPDGFLMSKSVYMYNDLVFHYNKEYVEEHVMKRLVDEYKEEVIVSDIEEEFYDGCEYHYGYRVTRKEIPTGNKIEIVIEGADVIVPELRFTIAPGDVESNSSIKQPFWEKILVNPKDNEEKRFIRRLVDNYKFHTIDGTSVEDAIEIGKPFYGKVENILHYTNGMAAKVYSF